MIDNEYFVVMTIKWNVKNHINHLCKLLTYSTPIKYRSEFIITLLYTNNTKSKCYTMLIFRVPSCLSLTHIKAHIIKSCALAPTFHYLCEQETNSCSIPPCIPFAVNIFSNIIVVCISAPRSNLWNFSWRRWCQDMPKIDFRVVTNREVRQNCVQNVRDKIPDSELTSGTRVITKGTMSVYVQIRLQGCH